MRQMYTEDEARNIEAPDEPTIHMVGIVGLSDASWNQDRDVVKGINHQMNHT
jgi:hypothetical protein